MNRSEADEIAEWLAEAGLLGVRDEASLAQAFCEKCVEAGLPIGRAFVMIDTLHPLHESRAFFWDENPEVSFREEEFGSTREGTAAWNTSPFFHLIQRRETFLRCRLEAGETRGYSAAEELRAAGQTDYIVIVYRIRHAAKVEDVDGFYARWTTARPGGFTDEEIGHLKRLSPLLGLAIRSASQQRLAKTLVEAYLGRDPGRRVLNGGIKRGGVQQINAVLWFSDMTGYTRLSEKVETDQLIPLLNDYAEAVITSVQAAGGDVLKLIGDGILAIFAGRKPHEACSAAMRAERSLRERLAVLAASRRRGGQPVADVHLGLHVGEVFYGNIGSADRLDFTVVGPAVNEVSRISSLCSSVDRNNLFSSDFVAHLPEIERDRMVSVGRFALRGVGRAQMLYTCDPQERDTFSSD
jgi:adenylate cyclase